MEFLTMRELTTPQWDELIEQYVQLQVDSMDVNDLVSFVSQTLAEEYCELSSEDLKDEIKYSFDDEIFDELIDNVTEVN